MDPSDAPDPPHPPNRADDPARAEEAAPDAPNRPRSPAAAPSTEVDDHRGGGATLVPQELELPSGSQRPPDPDHFDPPEPAQFTASLDRAAQRAAERVAAEEGGIGAGAVRPPEALAAPALEASPEVAGEGLRTTHDPAMMVPMRGGPSPVRSYRTLHGVWLGVTLGVVAAGLAVFVVLVVLALVA